MAESYETAPGTTSAHSELHGEKAAILIVVDTSAIGATALNVPETELFHTLFSREVTLVGYTTLRRLSGASKFG